MQILQLYGVKPVADLRETRYKPPEIPTGRQPPPSKRPPGEYHPEGRLPEKKPEPSHDELLKSILEEHVTFKEILIKLTKIAEHGATSPEPSGIYYNTPQTVITNPTPNPSAGQNLDPDGVTAAGTPNYQVEQVHNTLHRNAPKIGVINDGSRILYVISTQDAQTWSNEAPILPGEARFFFNVWSLALRSETAGVLATGQGGIYRATEYDFWLSYSGAGTATPNTNRNAFTARVVNAPVLGAILPNIVVPNGYTLVVRANILNAGQVFIANNSAGTGIADATNAAIPGNRNTLNAGDAVRLFITNANLVAVAGSGAGQNVDILVEQ